MAIRTVIDGVDYTSAVQEASVTHQLSRPSFCSVKMPTFTAPFDEPERCKIWLDSGALDFHGSLVEIEDEGDEDEMWTTFTFADPTLIFEFRPARDADGDFSKPDFLETFKTGPKIVEAIVSHSIFAGDGSNADCEGPCGIQLGSFAGGGADLSGAPTDWPMPIAQVIALLVETGELDIRLDPIDSDGEIMGRLHGYNGDLGSVSGQSFEFATGSNNAAKCRRTVELGDLMNKLWIYLGPRVKTAADPKGDQHWRSSITGTNPANFPNPPYAAIAAAVEASRTRYFQRMIIRIFDARGDEAATQKELYRRWWLTESWLRARPKTMVHLTPEPGIAPQFRVGDFIDVAAGYGFRGGFAGQQRVMEYTYRWDHSGVIELGEPILQTGAPAVVATAHSERP